MKRLVVALLACVLSAGCIPEKPEEPVEPEMTTEAQVIAEPESPEELLFSEWLVLASDPDLRMSDMRAFQICDELSQANPTALSPILDLLDAETTDAGLKVYILQSININMTSAYIPQLLELLESNERTTRSCATTLLGSVRDPAVVDHLEELKNDDDPRVAFSALSGLAQQAPEKYREEFISDYFSEEATRARKAEVMRVIFLKPQESDVRVLEAEIADPESEMGIRSLSAMLLGSFGNLDSIPALEKGIELSEDDQFKQLALSTIATIQERYKA